MHDLIDYAFFASLGAVCGFCGIFSEASLLTHRTLFGAILSGALLCPTVLLASNNLLGDEYYGTNVAISILTAIFRWQLVVPVANLFIKAIFDLLDKLPNRITFKK